MKLITRNGQLELPGDFKLTMERNNPMLSGDGDATIPATLPSSTNNMAAIGHLERIDHANKRENKVDAILQVGPVQKRGKLVIDMVHRLDGIDASFAIDSSDLYVTSKDKSLKDIIDERNGGVGLKIPFATVSDACLYMINIYNGGYPNADFVVFPVAVSSYETGDDDNKQTIYQYNNEPGGTYGLVFEERFVMEDGVNMLVPEGYGIAPFLKLHRMINIIFQCLGYTVTQNCFEQQNLDKFVIVHNCPDCLVRPLLDYKDLVPSCTLSEFLEWLLAKFHVQPIVNSETREVRIVMMETMLDDHTLNCDVDLTDKVEGDWEVQLNQSKRIVLAPTTSIEGTEPAADTLDKLMATYGTYYEANEVAYKTLEGNNPTLCDCLVLRTSTGLFYRLERDLITGKQVAVYVGSCFFTYDRDNSTDTESLGQSDVVPLMLCGTKNEVAPYIGDRIHRHTSYNGSGADDTKQEIIVVQARSTVDHGAYKTTGTTMRSIPYQDTNGSYSFLFGLHNYGMYSRFWSKYNTLLLNNPTHLKGRLKLGVADFLQMNMEKMKLCNGQRLLPVSASASIGERMSLTEAEFIVVKNYENGVTDTPITPSGATSYRWQLAYSYNGEPFDIEAFVQAAFDDYCAYYIQYGFPMPVLLDWTAEFDDIGSGHVWFGSPQANEIKTFSTKVHIKMKIKNPLWVSTDAGIIHTGSGYWTWQTIEMPNETALHEHPELYEHDVILTLTATAM